MSIEQGTGQYKLGKIIIEYEAEEPGGYREGYRARRIQKDIELLGYRRKQRQQDTE